MAFPRQQHFLTFSPLCSSWDSAPELAAEDLGAQEGKDAEKEKEEDEEGHDRLNRVDQRPQQVLKGSPVPETRIRLNLVFNLKVLEKIVAFFY